jgi:hypothetical protein
MLAKEMGDVQESSDVLGSKKKDARKLSVSESNAQTDISLDYLEGLVEVHGDFAF